MIYNNVYVTVSDRSPWIEIEGEEDEHEHEHEHDAITDNNKVFSPAPQPADINAEHSC